MAQATPSTSFDVVIVTPDKVLFDGSATRIMVPGYEQELAVLPDHTPLYTQLKQGEILIHPEEKDLKTIPIESGVMRVKQNKVTIILGFQE